MDKKEASTFKRTLMDLRKMRRDVSMREETDPKKVAHTLDTILKEAIALTTVEDTTMSNAAIKEIKQIRKAMVAGQIKAGSSTASYIGAFSAVLDQIDDVGKELDKQDKEDRSTSSIMDSLPSSDTIISAIMTANPIFGYTMKIGRDLVSTAKQKQEKKHKREQDEARLRKERLIEQESLINQQLETDEMVRDNIQEDESVDNVSRGYEVLLEAIRDEIVVISRFLRADTQDELDRVYNERQQELEEAFNAPTEVLEKIYDEDLKQNKSELERLNINESNNAEDNLESSNDTPSKKSSGFMDSIFDGGVDALISPFNKMFSFIGSAGSLLLKGLKFGVLVASFKMMYDFVDGIFNAGKILGSNDISWGDRITVGVSSVLSGMLSMLDSVFGWFGGDLMGDKSKDDWTKQYYDFFDNFGSDLFFNIKHLTNSILDTFKTWASDSADYVTELAKDAFSPILNIITSIRDYIQEKIYDLIPDFAKDLFGIGGEDNEKEKTLRENIKKMNKREGEMKNIDDGYDNETYNGDINKSYIEDKSAIMSNKSDNSVATSASEQYDNEYINNNNKGGNTSIIAPNSSNTTVNQSSYSGSSSSENREPTHRKMNNMNMYFASGMM